MVPGIAGVAESLKNMVTSGTPKKMSKAASPHPLDPLSADEITRTGRAIRKHFTEQTEVKATKIVYIALVEPEKLDVLKYLGIPTSVEQLGKTEPDGSVTLPRRAESSLIDVLSGTGYRIYCTIKSDDVSVDTVEMLPRGTEPGITMEELSEAEETVRKDARVQKLCADVGVLPHQICADGWSIGYDKRFPGRRLQQCLMYARYSEHDNLYAHPLDFIPVVDSNSNEVLWIDFAAHPASGSGELTVKASVPLEDLSKDSLEHAGRARIPPPRTNFDFLPDLLSQQEGGFPMRRDVKPLHVVQPEGVSFKMNGNRLSWQKWDMHIATHHREGLILSTVTYDDKGTVRPLFYRMSLSEMVVPYGNPAWPHPRKFAFDTGEYGLGITMNSLSLGCDCLGSIQYLDATFCNHAGEPVVVPNAICIHEEDDGLLWKHTDFRPGGRGHAVRSRKLVISMICTVANYEYALYWNFRQDGSLQCEIKLTGILNLYTMAEGEQQGRHGTEVAPRVMAHHHQHLFCTRIEPMLDGLQNTVAEVDIVPMDEPTESDENWAGNGFETRKTIFNTSAEGVRDAAPKKNRTWMIMNENKKHYASKQPIAYKIMCKDMPPLLAKPNSLVAKRAPFALHNIWVAPYDAKQIYPAGHFVPQTMETPEDSILSFVAGEKNIRNTDLAVWITWGVTHAARPEEFPVMPVEHTYLNFKPVGFFDKNPALDVPAVKDVNSKRAFDDNRVGVVDTSGSNGTSNGSNGSACCA